MPANVDPGLSMFLYLLLRLPQNVSVVDKVFPAFDGEGITVTEQIEIIGDLK